MYLKLNDVVVVTTGAAKGKKGRVMRLDKEGGRVWVQGVNLRFKHLRRSQKNPRGGRVEQEGPLDVSNVQLVDPKSQKPTRVGFRIEKGRKVRFAKRSGEALP